MMLAMVWGTLGGATPRRIYAAGSGLDMLSLPETVKEIIELSGLVHPSVLYLGTATYDAPDAQKTQSQGFLDAGCTVNALQLTVDPPGGAVMKGVFDAADIVLVSGGNTLWARDRWVTLGVDVLIKQAMARGAVLCGGSAGGIVWFDGGHSDSMEPQSYKNPPGPLLNPNMSAAELSSWAYIRVPGLGAVPGLFCPHYDITEGNGVIRANDFTTMMQRHSGELAVGVDNWAALRIDGNNYTVISREGKPGSVGPGGNWISTRNGTAGAWRLRMGADGQLKRTLAPTTGQVSDLLGEARYIVQSNMLPVARAQNPDDGKPATPTLY